jgi:hypothetical protein
VKPTELEVLKVLDYLGHELDPSILIGGWATQLRVEGEVSVDIDLIIASPALRNKLRSSLDDYSETKHHSGGMKVRGSVDQVHVDAYIPHESFLGNHLRLDVAILARHVDANEMRGWRLLTIEAHLLTKFAALVDRPDSEKGEKDAREIWALLQLPHDYQLAVEILISAARCSKDELARSLERMFEVLPSRASLNKTARRDVAVRKREWVDELSRQIRRLSAN